MKGKFRIANNLKNHSDDYLTKSHKNRKKEEKNSRVLSLKKRVYSVENSSNGLIFRKKTGEKLALFQLKKRAKNGRN